MQDGGRNRPLVRLLATVPQNAEVEIGFLQRAEIWLKKM